MDKFGESHKHFQKIISLIGNSSKFIGQISNTPDYEKNGFNTNLISQNLTKIIKWAKAAQSFVGVYLSQNYYTPVQQNTQEAEVRGDTEGSLNSENLSFYSNVGENSSTSSIDITNAEKLYFENQELEITLEIVYSDLTSKSKEIEGLKKSLRRLEPFECILEPFKPDGINDKKERMIAIFNMTQNLQRSHSGSMGKRSLKFNAISESGRRRMFDDLEGRRGGDDRDG